MDSQYIKKKNLPDSSGVYLFKSGKKILYIGKATSIRDRVKSYFSNDLFETRGPLIVKMLLEAKSVDFIKTDSVLEAIFLEAELIKKYQPKFNTKEKSDKSFLCVVITDEAFPQILLVRGKNLGSKELKTINYKLKTIFGPFSNSSQIRDALKIVRKIFPYRDDKCLPKQGKPCFGRQVGLCPGVCTGEISEKDYAKNIRHIELFFQGKKTKILKELEKEMRQSAVRQEFEKAGEFKRQLFAIKHIQDIALLKNEEMMFSNVIHAKAGIQSLVLDSRPRIHKDKPVRWNDRKYSELGAEKFFRIESYDIAHTSGKETVEVMVVFENGESNKKEYRTFNIKSGKGNDDVNNLGEVISRRMNHLEWKFPNLIVVDGGVGQKKIAEKILEKMSLKIPVVAVTKNKKHKPVAILGNKEIINKNKSEILQTNAEAHRFAISIHRKKRSKSFL